LNIPAFRWAADASIAATIHSAAPVLIRKHEDGTSDNPWAIRFRQLFNMATDSDLFIDNSEVAQSIVDRDGAMAVLRDGRKFYPLYEGKMLWHFDHRYGTYDGQTRKQANKGVLPHVDDSTHNDPVYRIQPRYWVTADQTNSALDRDIENDCYFAWRDVGPTERSFVGCITPKTATGHKLHF
jgi:hypothetical protein